MNLIRKIKRYALLLIAVLFTASGYAQILDSLLLGHNIFELLNTTGIYGNSTTIDQPTSLKSAILDQIVQNRSKKIQGYRIRIFSSNAQTGRVASQAVKEEFELLFPHIRAQQKFENLDFRVVVGDFRTKSEAMRFLKELLALPQYRAAVVVREMIEFPTL